MTQVPKLTFGFLCTLHRDDEEYRGDAYDPRGRRISNHGLLKIDEFQKKRCLCDKSPSEDEQEPKFPPAKRLRGDLPEDEDARTRLAKIDSHLRTLDPPRCLVRVPGDGSCAFHCLAKNLEPFRGDVTHEQLRAEIVQHLKDNFSQYEGFSENLESLIEKLAAGDWADHLAFQAFVDKHQRYKLKIFKYTLDGHDDGTTEVLAQNSIHLHDFETFFLVQVAQLHFDCTQLLSQGEIPLNRVL